MTALGVHDVLNSITFALKAKIFQLGNSFPHQKHRVSMLKIIPVHCGHFNWKVLSDCLN